MKMQRLIIENFRNFEELNVDLDNKNIIFGLNDIGKTNFLCAIRFLLDRDYRRKGFTDSDFFLKDVNREIKITLEVNIEGDTHDDRKIRSRMAGAINSAATSVYFQLIANYDPENLCGDPKLYWGYDINDLEDIPSSQTYCEIDKLFNVIYIDSSIQLEQVFKKYTKELFRDKKGITESERKKIKKNIDNLNNCIAKLTNIKQLEKDIVDEYNNYRNEKDLSIAIKSEIEIDNIHSRLTPYICYDVCETFPTSGDGRRKILSYTLLTIENKKFEDKKINIFLIEELENHLHRSMQIGLSNQLFNSLLFNYMFLTTHSSLIVSYMDKVNLIKLSKGVSTKGKACYYKVPTEYDLLKKKLNENLANAIYADTVLLVEGPSEKILFEKIMSVKCKDYEARGGYILEVDGINFIEYYKILKQLGINIIIKTDNDLKLNEKKKEYNLLGLNRCLRLVNKPIIDNVSTDVKTFESERYNIQKDIFNNKYKKTCQALRVKKVYLSQVDLENDLYQAIPTVMDSFTKKQNTKKSAVDYMQSAKMINMIELCNHLRNSDIEKIYSHHLFECVKELINKCN